MNRNNAKVADLQSQMTKKVINVQFGRLGDWIFLVLQEGGVEKPLHLFIHFHLFSSFLFFS